MAITVRLGSLSFSCIREEFASLSPNYIKCAVALEKGMSSGHCCFHLHCLFEFENDYTYIEIIDYYSKLFIDYPEITFHCEGVKNFKNYLVYISKEDTDIFIDGYSISDFSFRFQSYYYLKDMPFFDIGHHFVAKHRQYYKYLERLYKVLHFKWVSSYSYIGPWVDFDLDWCNKVLDWYINYVSTSYYFKKKHLYLYGDTNMGKSTLINHLIKYLGNRVYYVKEKHLFGDLCSEHKLIFWDEVPMRLDNVEMLKKAFGGQNFSINQKYCVERDFIITIPCILVSNYPLNDVALCSRFIQIEADRCCLQDFSIGLIEEVTTFFIEEDGELEI